MNTLTQSQHIQSQHQNHIGKTMNSLKISIPLNPNRKDYILSKTAVEQLKPAIEALGKLEPRLLSDAKEITFNTLTSLSLQLAAHQSVLAECNELIKTKPEALINAAMNRHFAIPLEIERLQKALAHRIKSRDAKIEELLKKQFTMAEIENIVEPVTQAEADAVAAQCEKLRSDSAKYLAFSSDSPFHDLEILRGTELFPSEHSA